MTTANVGQVVQETIATDPAPPGVAGSVVHEVTATNPSPPAVAGSVVQEVTATNPSPPAVASKLYVEIIASTLVPPYRGVKSEILQFIEATSEDTAPWLVRRMPRFVPLTAAVTTRPFLWIAL